MSKEFTRKEACRLQHRWINHAVHQSVHDPEIETTMNDLLQAWNQGKTLGFGERQALAVKTTYERMPDFGQLIQTSNGPQYCQAQDKRHTEIDAYFGVAEMNNDGWASKTCPAIYDEYRIS